MTMILQRMFLSLILLMNSKRILKSRLQKEKKKKQKLILKTSFLNSLLKILKQKSLIVCLTRRLMKWFRIMLTDFRCRALI